MKQKMCKIILGFPGVGKSYLKELYKGSNIKIIDSDSSYFSKDDFPNNYLKQAINYISQGVDILLLSTHKDVRKEIKKVNFPENTELIICYPDLSIKDLWIDRLMKRNNPECFINLIKENYESWINEIISENWENQYIIDLKNKYYLSDFII